jgi:hypothetical protein
MMFISGKGTNCMDKSILRTVSLLIIGCLLSSVISFGVIAQNNIELVTINDTERDWYGSEYYTSPSNGGNQQDHIRLISAGTAGAAMATRTATDSDDTAMLWMQYINNSVRPQKDLTIYKNLSTPIKGGRFSFYFWLSNHYANLAFGLEAIAYDAGGTAYSLGKPFNNTGIQWSVGDGNAVNPNPGLSNGWTHYECDMPADVIVEKMAIRMYVRDNYTPAAPFYASIPNPSWPDMCYSVIDEISIKDTTTPVNTVFDGEDPATWNADYGSVTNVSNQFSRFITNGTSALDITADYRALSSVKVHKSLVKGVRGGRFSYKMFNYSVNSRVDGQPRSSVRAFATATDGSKIDLGRYPKDEAGYIEYGGNPVTGQIYFGWQYYVANLPVDKTIKAIDLVFEESTLQSVAIKYFVDEIKFMDSVFTDLAVEPEIGTTINDTERDWYGNEYYKAPGNNWNQQDHIRLITAGTAGTAMSTRTATDRDDTAMLWMQFINATVSKSGVPTKIRDSRKELSIFKDLPVPLKGGKFSFYLWLSNMYASGSFGLEAIGYDINGKSYSFGKMFDKEGLLFSGHKDLKGYGVGWNHYLGNIPANVFIEKIEIRMFVIENPVKAPYYSSIPNPSWANEYYSVIDEISYKNTTKDQNVVFDGENPATWKIDYGTVSQINESNIPRFIANGTTALEINADFKMNKNLRSRVNLHKDLDKGVKGGRFAFKIYNTSNSGVKGQPKTTVRVIATATDGTRILLDKYPDNPDGFINFGGIPKNSQIFYGWQYYITNMPSDKVIKAVDILLEESVGWHIIMKYYIDEIKFIDSSFEALKPVYEKPVKNTGVSVKDSERDWYSSEFYEAPAGANVWIEQDHIRLINQEAVKTIPSAKIRTKEDPDNLAMLWLTYLNATVNKNGVPTKVRGGKAEDSLFKVLPVPLKGGRFSFYFWFSNYFAQGSFGLEAVGYDKDGKAYSLGKMFDEEGMPFSGNRDMPNSGVGWLHYEKDMPAGIYIEKMEIKIYKIENPVLNYQNYYPSIPNPSWPGVNHCTIDDISFNNTEKASNVVFDGEDPMVWSADYGIVDQLSDINNPAFILNGTSALDINIDYLINGNASSKATIKKDLEKGVKGGIFSFKIFNASNNPRVKGDPRSSLRVIGITTEGKRLDLGRYPQKSADCIEYGGFPQNKQIYFGWQYFKAELPADQVIKSIEIAFEESTGKAITMEYFIDEMKYVDSEFIELEEPRSEVLSQSSASSSNYSAVSEDLSNKGFFSNSVLLIILASIALILSGAVAFFIRQRKQKQADKT